LKSILEGSKKVADIISEIAAASKEQAEGIGQVTNAVSQMDQVTQQNASAAEESASASEELTSQAEALRGMVNELQQVIGGSSSVATTAQPGKPGTGVERRQSMAHLDIKKGKGGTGLSFKTPAKAGGPKVVKPEDIIPLDDDNKLKQF
jgi:methyl-accepting chemotaxis protein